ncbi:transposase family protein [Specibacter cremeus]|uniref:transposase family protein n=1 Tax=Specibacter cremeus TaxID=1629051 RepID=UPI00197C55F2
MPELHSDKHHTTGVSVQLACTLAGHLARVSNPLPGSVHDVKALRESGLLDVPPTETRHSTWAIRAISAWA